MTWLSVADYVRSLGIDAWLVGGGVRDELLGREVRDTDFVVPGVGHAELKAALAAHGRVEDLVVAGRRIGVRLYPYDRDVRVLAPAGIEFAPPRIERSTGPGRHDFDIVADASIPLERDMQRRDFTINAIAKRLSTGELLDPLGGRDDLERRVLRVTSPTSFRDDPLRIIRGLRFVSELDVEPDDETVRQMHEWAPHVRLVSAERIGGGLAADGLGELSKLLLGAHPKKALRLARETGVLTVVLPEFEPAIAHHLPTARQRDTVDEHIFSVVQNAADAGASLATRLAALLHDLAKPLDRGGRRHAAVGAEIAAAVMRRLRYPTRLQEQVVAIAREHSFPLDGEIDGERARRFLAAHGPELARDLMDHKEADLRAKNVEPWELPALARLRAAVASEAVSPYRIRDLAIDGTDLKELGYDEGPELGSALRTLLDDVLADPKRNTRKWLIQRARTLRT